MAKIFNTAASCHVRNNSTHIHSNILIMFRRLFDGEHQEGLPRHRAKAVPPPPTRHLEQSPCKAYHCNESILCMLIHFHRYQRHHQPYLLQKQIGFAFRCLLSLRGRCDKQQETSSSCQMLSSLHMSPEITKRTKLVSTNVGCEIQMELQPSFRPLSKNCLDEQTWERDLRFPSMSTQNRKK